MHLSHLIQTYGYWGLCGALAVEYLFVPVPGETTLVTAGVFSKNPTYHLSVFWLIFATGFGTFAGSMFAYIIGRTLGRPVLERFGRFIRITPQRIDKAEVLFQKYTLPTLVFSRYIAVVRIIVPYLAGINRVKLWLYIPVMFLSSMAWTATFILAGGVIERAWKQVSHHWRTELIPAIIILIVLIVAYWYLHRWLKKRVE